jgi:dCMP deaminase
MKQKHKVAFMKFAVAMSELSHCQLRKVGAVIVKDGSSISEGYNGTPAGEDNCCEGDDGKTLRTVVHAEDNALKKLIRKTESSVGATMFVTDCPCERCAARIVDAGIVQVFYLNEFKREDGKRYLEDRNIPVVRMSLEVENPCTCK